jgi:CRISPR/Cas system-associated exonuclease Cas4 (RecB family)
MTIANELIKAITASSKGSARSNQVRIGPSEIGGCRRKVWMRFNKYETTNPNTLRLASVMGTAIHSYIQEAFTLQDPFGERYMMETEGADEGLLVGHVDMYDKVNYEVIDWKTTKKSNLGYFPSKQQRWQVQLYGYLLELNGYRVENVTLVAIPRDGDERDIVYHTEPYNIEIAHEALNWLGETLQGEMPAPEKDPSFCKFYCGYYDETPNPIGCPGRPKVEAEGAVIDDATVSLAAKDYLRLTQDIAMLEELKEKAKAQLEGVNGVTADGIKVLWTSVAGRKIIDEEAVKASLGEVPYRHGKDSFRLTVK